MERNRLNAIMLAIVASLLVMIAGKACMSGYESKNADKKSNSAADIYPTAPEQKAVYYYNGQVYDHMPEVTEATDSESVTEPVYAVVTDENGEIAATVPVEETAEDTETEAAQMPTKSLLEEYNENKRDKDPLSGYNHDIVQPEAVEDITYPGDITLHID